MDSDDPFQISENDRTIIRPTPGGTRNRPQQEQPIFSGGKASPLPSNLGIPDTSSRSMERETISSLGGGNFANIDKINGSGLNPIVDSATPLLLLVDELRNSVSQNAVMDMRERLIQIVRQFEDKCRFAGVDQESTLTSRYLLCAFADEAVLGTPWGAESGWASSSLLSTFHSDNRGGEKFFRILEKLLAEPARNLNILELIHICLSLGFEGQYSLSDRGHVQVQGLRESLFRTISMQRGEFERDLSPTWRGANSGRSALIKYVPLWVVAALLGVLLLIVYGVFKFVAFTSAGPIYDQLEQIENEPPIELRDQ